MCDVWGRVGGIGKTIFCDILGSVDEIVMAIFV
jgi:hypothetical protein